YLFTLTATLATVAYAAKWFLPDPKFAKVLLVGATLVFPWAAAHLSFVVPRQYGLLKKMLGPATPARLVLATYGAIFSMGLFLANTAGAVTGDLEFLLALNAGVLLMCAFCTAAAVVWSWPMAPLMPIVIAYGLYNYTGPYLHEPLDWIVAHQTAAAMCMLLIIPSVIYGSLLVFLRSVENGALEKHVEEDIQD